MKAQDIEKIPDTVLLNKFMDYTTNYDYSIASNFEKLETFKSLYNEILKRMKKGDIK